MLWFEVPTWLFDYLFIGGLYTSSEIRTRGFGTIVRESDGEPVSLLHVLSPHEIRTTGVLGTFLLLLRMAILLISRIALYIAIWPFRMLDMANQLLNTDKDGIFKGLKIKVRYLRREGDIFVLQFLGAVLLVFVVVVIINYSLFITT